MSSFPGQQEPLQEFGLAQELDNDQVLLPELALINSLLEFLYTRWWQVQVSGLERLPVHSPLLLLVIQAA